MKLSTRLVYLALLSLPLAACESMNGWFGQTGEMPSGNYEGYRYSHYNTTRAVKAQNGQESAQVERAADSKGKSDVTVVEPGAAKVSMPKTSSTTSVSKEAPMVPGEAPKVE